MDEAAAGGSKADVFASSAASTGLTGHAWQSLYHFSIGAPVEDTRLTSEPGYGWERAAIPGSR